MQVNGERLMKHLEELSRKGGGEGPGITRAAFTKGYCEAADYIAGLMEQAGLKVRIDGIGNVIGVRAGKSGKRLITGSHIDTVAQGGMFDGALGVVGAIEALQSIGEQEIEMEHTVHVCAFIDEEVSALGSRAYAGIDLPPAFEERLEQNGLNKKVFMECGMDLKPDEHFLELHIEQGGILEAGGIDIGVVRRILSSANYMCRAKGAADHAGNTPMDMRDDAFMKTAGFALRMRELVLEHKDMVGTIGYVKANPGYRNVVPGEVEFSMELRAPAEADIEEVEKVLQKEFEPEGVLMKRTAFYEAAVMDDEIKNAIARICGELGLKHLAVNSGAGHDSQSFAGKLKTGMIFVPSRNGISHSPLEFTSAADCANGAAVLANVLLELDRTPVK